MWVVKLGGSLMQAPELRQWLELILQQDASPCVIVPGGGMFADAVRAAQASTGFDDVAAHRMALLAMEQYAWVLKSLCPQLVMVSSEREIGECCGRHRAMLWLPTEMALADASIPMNWEVTSDSLAAWLAGKISAERLVLVKHADFSEVPATLKELIEQGVLDTAFEEFAMALRCPIHVMGKSARERFRQLADGQPVAALTVDR